MVGVDYYNSCSVSIDRALEYMATPPITLVDFLN